LGGYRLENKTNYRWWNMYMYSIYVIYIVCIVCTVYTVCTVYSALPTFGRKKRWFNLSESWGDRKTKLSTTAALSIFFNTGLESFQYFKAIIKKTFRSYNIIETWISTKEIIVQASTTKDSTVRLHSVNSVHRGVVGVGDPAESMAKPMQVWHTALKGTILPKNGLVAPKTIQKR